MSLTIAELDRLAKDTGCAKHDDCLTCPLSECVLITKATSTRTKHRNGTIRKMAKHMNVREVAEKFGISIRTVRRALKEVADE